MEEHITRFESLFASFGDAIFRYFFFQLGNRDRAKELTQEVFMRTWQHLAAGKEIRYEKAFIYTIARNLFINEIRSKRPVDSLDALTEATGFEPTDDEPDPTEHAEQQELLRYLDQLSDSYREALVLRYLEGMAVKDIAALLGEKETNISMRIKRATDQLRSIYRQNSNAHPYPP